MRKEKIKEEAGAGIRVRVRVLPHQHVVLLHIPVWAHSILVLFQLKVKTLRPPKLEEDIIWAIVRVSCLL